MTKTCIKRIFISLTLISTLFIAGCINNEKELIQLKYGDKIDVSDFEHLDTSKSSFIRGAWYNSQNHDLIISLNDASYKYCNFPVPIWSGFKTAESFGKYYNSNIKGGYACPQTNCLSEAIKEGNNMLELNGYKETENGSWKDSNGRYPTSYIEGTVEELMTRVMSECTEIDKQKEKDKDIPAVPVTKSQEKPKQLLVKPKDTELEIEKCKTKLTEGVDPTEFVATINQIFAPKLEELKKRKQDGVRLLMECLKSEGGQSDKGRQLCQMITDKLSEEAESLEKQQIDGLEQLIKNQQQQNYQDCLNSI